MALHERERAALQGLAELALREDLGDRGDLTSTALLPEGLRGRATLVARQEGVVAGLPAAEAVFGLVDTALTFRPLVNDGDAVTPGTHLGTVEGPARSLLTGERTALNFLQRLSGVATLTRRYVRLVHGLPARILDTRKTTPGWRLLEKYAVRMGGGHNHRVGLYDGVLIKDNHLAALGTHADPVGEAIRRARAAWGPGVPLEVEVDGLAQLDAALPHQPDIILLDNMPPDELREAVRRRDAAGAAVQLEASGGVNLTTVRAIAEAGVDRISVGALTHSAPALDIALDTL